MPQKKVRGLVLGEGRMKVIAPIMADTVEAAAAQAVRLRGCAAVDMAELRLDALDATPGDALYASVLVEATAAVRAALGGEKPLLATLRTRREGGLRAVNPAAYETLLTALCASDRADLLDVEFSAGEEVCRRLTQAAHAAGLLTVFSRHDFEKAPPVPEMAAALTDMADAGADIAKLAVMAKAPADAAALLAATAQARAARRDALFITMAMGAPGTVTRVCGGAFGSCATFGAVEAVSAPGQPGAAALRAALDALGPVLL